MEFNHNTLSLFLCRRYGFIQREICEWLFVTPQQERKSQDQGENKNSFHEFNPFKIIALELTLFSRLEIVRSKTFSGLLELADIASKDPAQEPIHHNPDFIPQTDQPGQINGAPENPC
jgi:hypothetical protein